jgi:molybdenum cofactor synthesis domain-containing protein
MRAAIITISTSKAAGQGDDESGPALAEFARSIGAEVAGHEVIPDERPRIEATLRHWADDERCELVLTSGGTGFAPADVTPEATRAVIEREAPGIAEAMRAASREHTPNWMLSRGVAGIRGRSLIVNFPGNPRSVRQTARAIGPALPHAVALLTDGRGAHASHHPDDAVEAGASGENKSDPERGR